MTGRPRKVKVMRKAARKARSNRRMVTKSATPTHDPLNDLIAAGGRALDLKIDKTWIPAVRGHLQVTLRHGALVAGFALPDDAEPASVFKA